MIKIMLIALAALSMSCSIIKEKVKIAGPSLNPTIVGCEEKKACMLLAGLSYSNDEIDVRTYLCESDGGKILIIAKESEMITAVIPAITEVIQASAKEKMLKNVKFEASEVCDVEKDNANFIMGVINWHIE